MSADNLIKMANQIARYFATDPDPVAAAQGMRQHLQSFWTPGMLRQLGEWLQAHPQEEVEPLVRTVLQA